MPFPRGGRNAKAGCQERSSPFPGGTDSKTVPGSPVERSEIGRAAAINARNRLARIDHQAPGCGSPPLTLRVLAW